MATHTRGGLRDADVSRAVSHALRHAPWQYELELDAQGWAPVDQLLEALQAKGGAWLRVDRAALEAVLASATKQRHELVGDRIRALYGHSVPGRILNRPTSPPDVLYHGTSPATREIVQTEGLRPMRRQYVHLSADTEMAMAVGRRKSGTPVLLQIDAAAAAADGIEFYEGNDRVWLALHVPPHYIRASWSLR